MKILFNMTTEPFEDLGRFEDADDFRAFSRGFDGVELMCFGPDEKGIIPREMIVGYHLTYLPTWLGLWRGDWRALEREFGSLEAAQEFYGGLDREAVVRPYREDLARSLEYGAQYVVFHVAESTTEETFTFDYANSDREVVGAAAELINELFRDVDPWKGPALLLENLWVPGLSLRDLDAVRFLLDTVEYPNKGLMLDTGHLLHTNFDLATQEEGLAFINGKLDQMEAAGLLPFARGMHLHQSLTGAFCREVQASGYHPRETDYAKRQWDVLRTVYRIDEHKPFTCPGVEEMVRRLPLEFLSFEFITSSREMHRDYLEAQWKALPGFAAERGLRI